MAADDRMDLDFILEVLDVLERHGYHHHDDQHTGRAVGLIGDLARIYEGTQDTPAGTYHAEVPPAPQPGPGPPGPRADRDAVILSATETGTIAAALDEAADYKRDRAETCADCPDQSCRTCQWRLQGAETYDHLATQMLQAAEASRAASGQPDPAAPTRPAASPRPQPTRRPASDHPRQDTGRTRNPPASHAPVSLPADGGQGPGAKCRTPTTCPFPDYSPLATRPSRVRDRGRPAPRLAARRPPSLAELLETGTHPRTRSRPGSRTMTPTRKYTAMTLTINDTTMTSDQTAHTARQAPGRQHGWEVSWLPGQILDRNTAITAMILADTAAEQRPARGPPALAAHPGLGRRARPDRHPTRSPAASQPPGDIQPPAGTSRRAAQTARQPIEQPTHRDQHDRWIPSRAYQNAA